MSRQDVETAIEETLPKLSRLGALVRFDLGQDGHYIIDARGGKAVLAHGDDSALDEDCVIRITADNLMKLIRGQMDPMLGYTMGRIKVAGSMGVAMKLVGAIA